MVSGWQERILNTIAASADAKSASLTPKNPPVRRYISRVNAMAGRTLVHIRTLYYRDYRWMKLRISIEYAASESREILGISLEVTLLYEAWCAYSLDKVHANGTCKHTIGKGIGNVAPVIW